MRTADSPGGKTAGERTVYPSLSRIRQTLRSATPIPAPSIRFQITRSATGCNVSRGKAKSKSLSRRKSKKNKINIVFQFPQSAQEETPDGRSWNSGKTVRDFPFCRGRVSISGRRSPAAEDTVPGPHPGRPGLQNRPRHPAEAESVQTQADPVSVSHVSDPR